MLPTTTPINNRSNRCRSLPRIAALIVTAASANSVSVPYRRSPDPHHASDGDRESPADTIAAAAAAPIRIASHRVVDRSPSAALTLPPTTINAVTLAIAAVHRKAALWVSNGFAANGIISDGHTI